MRYSAITLTDAPLPMDTVLAKITSHPFVTGLLVLCFAVSIFAYWARVRYENSPGYQRPLTPKEIDEQGETPPRAPH